MTTPTRVVAYTALAVATAAIAALLLMLHLADIQQILWLALVGWGAAAMLIALDSREQSYAARDDADRALAAMQSITDHLAGAEGPSKGRHAATHSRRVNALSDRRTDELPVPRVSRSATDGKTGVTNA